MKWTGNTIWVPAVAVAAMVALGLVGVTPASAGPDGAGMYARNCALCHGADGQGYASGNAPALSNQDFLVIASDRFIRHAVEHGRPGTAMSAWGTFYGGPLSLPQGDVVVDHLRSKQTVATVILDTDPINGSLDNGRAIYGRRCASCHGDGGGGGSAPSLNNPTFLSSVLDHYLRHSIENGRGGTPMVGFGGTLTSDEVADLVDLIRNWSEPTPPAPLLARQPSMVLNSGGAGATLGTLREGKYVSVAGLHGALASGAKMVLLDARAGSDWRRAHIAGAYSLPFYDVDKVAKLRKKIPTDGTWIVCYCSSPRAGAEVLADALRAAGFANVAVLDEGYLGWIEAGHLVEDNTPPPPQ